MSWKFLETDKIIKTTELSDFINTESYVPDDFLNFFGKEGERLALMFNGREYPAYVETEGGNPKLKLSKVLIRKFGEVFPQYNSWFQDIKDSEKTPCIEIIKESDHYNIRLLIENKEINGNKEENIEENKEDPKQKKSGLQGLLKKWIIDYPNYYPRDFRFSFKDVINEEIPGALVGLEKIKTGNYSVQGFAGDSQWAEIPWVMVTDKRIENSIDNGLHLVYFLAMDSRKLYLSIIYTESGLGIRSLSEKVNELKEKVDTKNYKTNHQELLLANATLVSGILCYREYTEDMPEDDVLEAEFEDFRKIYAACIAMDSEPMDITSDDEFMEASIENHQESVEENSSEELQNEVLNEVAEPEQKDQPIFKKGIAYNEIDDESNAMDLEIQMPNIEEEVKTEKMKIAMESIKLQEKFIFEEQNEDDDIVNEQDEIREHQKENIKKSVQDDRDFMKKLKHYPVKNETLTSYLQLILAKMANKGFIYPSELVKCYYLSLKSKPFVMIKGYVGSGKTSLPRLFAESIGANAENGRFLRVLVGKNWKDEKSIFGTLDSRGHFIPGPIMMILKSSKENPEKPHFFLFDEMDRSLPENYMRLLLEGINGNDEPFLSREDFGADIAAYREYGELHFPDNLYVVGTINGGPGSFPIESRVIDSGNTLEMPTVEISAFPNFGSSVGESNWDNNQFKLQNKSQGLSEIIEKLMYLLNELQNILANFDHPMGYRGKNEILAFGINSGVESLFNEKEVIDLAILQRILPAINEQKDKNDDVYKVLVCFGLEESLKQSLLNEETKMKFCNRLEKILKAEALPCPRSGEQIIKKLKSLIE
ncbi:DUF3578 domain-containing protein [Acetobacterium paludosum]|uniref:DUF3578 domain-containing protein n=1 Tax=Acetobacterium paludosum TaxID=52693 RepID=A0A923KST7_9FIRM|nr:DUF3578 domain-containing protein [Acetobacterium paludosum]MBC3888712.1 DUF3578 domain-containing protein [Acetobacterium paludosum]